LVRGDAVEIADVSLLRMRIRVFGAIGGSATSSNANPVQPWLDIAAWFGDEKEPSTFLKALEAARRLATQEDKPGLARRSVIAAGL
jgi:hypothetical protein